MPNRAPIRAAVALVLAVALGATATPAAASPPAECREAVCAGTIALGASGGPWRSPQAFYPNNEDLFAGVGLGKRPLAEVRRYGPGLCRHRLTGPGTVVVVKACGPQATLVVRLVRVKPGARLLRVAYAARPLIRGDSEPALSESIDAGLRQITGLMRG